LAVTFLEEAQGLLSRFVSVYLGYITQGGAGVALVGCYEHIAQVLLYLSLSLHKGDNMATP
jgi:hypothetical protein